MQQTTIPNLTPGETGYQTAGGNLVAVSYKPAPHQRVGYLCVVSVARVVNSSGVAINKADGQPMTLDFNFSIRGDNITATNPLSAIEAEWLVDVEKFADHEISAQNHLAALLA